MTRDKVQGFLLGLGAGVLLACFLKPVYKLEEAPPERLPDVPAGQGDEFSEAARA